jgi:hypothetical protein
MGKELGTVESAVGHLRRKLHTPQKVLEERVGAERIKYGIDFDPQQTIIVELIGLFQPCDSSIAKVS